MKTAVLFLAHFIEESVILKYERLRNEILSEYNLYWALQTDSGINYQSLLDRDLNELVSVYGDSEEESDVCYAGCTEDTQSCSPGYHYCTNDPSRLGSWSSFGSGCVAECNTARAHCECDSKLEY